MKKKTLIVPIVFDLWDYYKERPDFSWVFEIYTNYCVNNDMVLIAQEDYFKQEVDCLDKFYKRQLKNTPRKDLINNTKEEFFKYSIKNPETLEINKGKKASFKDQVYFMSHVNDVYISVINKKLDQVEKDLGRKVDGIFTWYWNPSLEKLTRDRNIRLIQLEISPIRDIGMRKNHTTTLSYFQFKNKYDSKYVEGLYEKFLKSPDIKNLKIFSRMELLSMFLKTEDINLLKMMHDSPKYELGIAPPFKSDFYFEIHTNEQVEDTFKKVDKLFSPKKVSLRYHPGKERKIGNPEWNVDDSEKVMYWIVNCRRILTYVSNIAFDAMLFGRTVYLLSDDMPFSSQSVNLLDCKEESVVSSLYLNFMIFGYFTPWNLMFNQEYIDWRLTNPSITDIYRYNQKYILDCFGIKNMKKATAKTFLKEVHKLDDKKINELLDYSESNCKVDLRQKRKEIFKLKFEVERDKKEIAELSAVAGEYKNFQQTKIWKCLTLWRKFKKYFKNFFINIFRDGPKMTFSRIFSRITGYIKRKIDIYKGEHRYDKWVKEYKIDSQQRAELVKECENFKYKPLISVIMPVYNVDVKWIRKAVDSVKNQIYSNWELCIADDASTGFRLKEYLEEISDDPKIKVVFRKKNGHISQASNSALELADGEFIALMDDDDEIYPDALYRVVKAVNSNPDIGIIYTDEDKMELNGDRVDPVVKPDYSPDYLLSTNYFCHFTVIKRNIVLKIGGLRKGYEGSQDYDLFLRAVEETDKVVHVPYILYGWRKIPGSTALNYDEKGYAEKASLQSLEDTIIRRKLDAKVKKGLQAGFFHVKYNLYGNPLVTILIDAQSVEKEKIEKNIRRNTYYEDITIQYYSDLKKAVKECKTNYFIVFDKNIQIENYNWVECLLEHVQRKEIIAASGKVFDNDRNILFTGFEKINNSIVNMHRILPSNMQVRANLISNYGILPLVCIMTTKEKFKNLKIIKSEDYPFDFVEIENKNINNRLLYTPYAESIYLNNMKIYERDFLELIGK